MNTFYKEVHQDTMKSLNDGEVCRIVSLSAQAGAIRVGSSVKLYCSKTKESMKGMIVGYGIGGTLIRKARS